LFTCLQGLHARSCERTLGKEFTASNTFTRPFARTNLLLSSVSPPFHKKSPHVYFLSSPPPPSLINSFSPCKEYTQLQGLQSARILVSPPFFSIIVRAIPTQRARKFFPLREGDGRGPWTNFICLLFGQEVLKFVSACSLFAAFSPALPARS